MASTLPETFGQVLRTHRERKGLSQMALAAGAGLHLNAIGSLERGARSPTLQTLLLLGRAMGIPASRLVSDVEKAKPSLE